MGRNHRRGDETRPRQGAKPVQRLEESWLDRLCLYGWGVDKRRTRIGHWMMAKKGEEPRE